jgi:hypothetical protein
LSEDFIMRSILVVVAGLLFATEARPGDDPPAAWLHNLKVLSDRIDDVTTAENILASFVKPGMSDAERARALWTAAVKYRHQTAPPNEYLAGDWEAHDPVKLFNSYGYCMCCCCASLVEALNRLDGREARGRILNGHSVAEVRYGGGWHMYDPSLINYFPKPGSGEAASVDEVSAAITRWYADNPGVRGNAGKLDAIMRSDGRTGWKTRGPALLAQCPYYRLGFFPAGTHGWNSTMVEYDRKSEIYDYGYSVGHRALLSLRPGESIEREAGNRGLHVNAAEAPGWEDLRARAPEADLAYVKDVLPGYRGGVVGNGTHKYAPDLSSGGLAPGAEVYENLTTGASPALHPKTSGKPGVAVIAMISPYVYLGGRVTLQALRNGPTDKVAVSLSTNNGRTFTPLWSADKAGRSQATIALGERILRRYAFWLKVEIESTHAASAGLDTLTIECDIQHAPRTLAWLGKGSNTITVAADADTALASRAISCRITPDAAFSKNETSASMGITVDNLDVRDGSCWWKSGTGTMTVPVQTPGDMVGLRFCLQGRARGEKDRIRTQVSFDNGATWKEAALFAGPTPGRTEVSRLTTLPAGARKALVRYELKGNNTVGIFSFRIDADYRDPLAAVSTRPFQVVHRWKENGAEKSHVETVQKLPWRYQIDTATEPDMLSVRVEMPAK